MDEPANGSRVSTGWVFPAELVHVAAVRAALRRALAAAAASPNDSDEQDWSQRRDDVETVADELAANAVRHARGDKFTVELVRTRRTLELTVHDGGGPTVPTLGEPPDPLTAFDTDGIDGSGPPEPEAFEHGRGLRLVAACADDWGYRTDESGCATWATFTRHPAG